MLLELENVKIAHGGVTAVWDVTLTVAPGDFVAIVGPNGAGKTSLMSAIAGLVPVQSGSIRFDGADITTVPAERRAGFGIVLSPEGRRLFPEMSVEENLIAGAHLAPGWAEVRRRLEEVRSVFPKLKERADQSARTLSGGEQQMVAIGRALMARPRLLLLDEPSLGLAPIIVDELFRTLKAIHGDGLTIVLVEQNVRQSLELAQTAHVLESGRLRLSGSAHDLLNDPYIKTAYMGF
ncbi:MAG: ABC transporter ATP-binding protein [Pseudomonadota bacterium]